MQLTGKIRTTSADVPSCGDRLDGDVSFSHVTGHSVIAAAEALPRRELKPANDRRVLVIACRALARALLDIVGRNDLTNIVLECFPASLHNTPTTRSLVVRRGLSRSS